MFNKSLRKKRYSSCLTPEEYILIENLLEYKVDPREIKPTHDYYDILNACLYVLKTAVIGMIYLKIFLTIKPLILDLINGLKMMFLMVLMKF